MSAAGMEPPFPALAVAQEELDFELAVLKSLPGVTGPSPHSRAAALVPPRYAIRGGMVILVLA